MLRTIVLATIVALTAGCLGGIGAEDAVSLSLEDAIVTDQVDMKSNKFLPKSIRVAPGATVTWTNADPSGHTVTPANESQWGGPGSGDLPADWIKGGESWSWTFEEPGTYTYYCVPHGWKDEDTGEVYGMMAVVHVVDESAS